MQAPQLHASAGGPQSIRPAVDLRFPANRDLVVAAAAAGLDCGVLSLFAWGEKSWSGELASEEVEGGVAPSSVRFLLFSLLALGEKKERMSCCFSFSN